MKEIEYIEEESYEEGLYFEVKKQKESYEKVLKEYESCIWAFFKETKGFKGGIEEKNIQIPTYRFIGKPHHDLELICTERIPLADIYDFCEVFNYFLPIIVEEPLSEFQRSEYLTKYYFIKKGVKFNEFGKDISYK